MFSCIPTIENLANKFYFQMNFNVFSFFLFLTISSSSSPNCSPDYISSSTTKIRLCPQNKIEIITEDQIKILGIFESETSTENTHFYNNGAECDSGGTYSGELVFTCCAPNHKAREYHLNSAAQVAPCFFILEACSEKVCTPERLQLQEVVPDRLPPTMLHIGVKDVIKQMLDSGDYPTTSLPADNVVVDVAAGAASAVNMDGIMDVVRKAFAGLGVVGVEKSSTESNTMAVVSTDKDTQRTNGGPSTPSIQMIQIDNNMLQSLLQNDKDNNNNDNNNDDGKDKETNGEKQTTKDLKQQLLEQIQKAVKDGKFQELLTEQQEQQKQQTTATRESSARQKSFEKKQRDLEQQEKEKQTRTNSHRQRYSAANAHAKQESSLPYMSKDIRISTRDSVKKMFQRSYDYYMSHAFPWDELLPMSCSGTSSPLTGGGALTLVDSLDTLVIMQNYTEFVAAVWRVQDTLDFDIDLNVSVFETTIRVLGKRRSEHREWSTVVIVIVIFIS